ncbi:PepSY-associated TM helix domain-containing protein [Thalassotalea atypica]|uniref:PepSY-associated TM helix domain-containing protein n=1 Tax=Thalassotalea atypica TaxID=2054316 RepID=UPI0025747CC0|nr:PepSY-associated TM helix domain-containing protein [Thalassotalea atypica]
MRKKLFRWHSISALIALIPIMVIAVTGSILVFKVELDTWLMPEHMTVAATEYQERANLNTLILKVANTHPNYLMGSWELFDDKARADTAYIIHKGTGQWYKLYVDQYQGNLLSTPVSVTHDITDWLLSLHYTFLLDFTGTVLGSVFAVILLFLGVSGIILHRNFWSKLFTLRFSAARRVFFSDVHKFIGIMSSPILLILAITGGYYNIAAVVHEVSEHIEAHPLLIEPLYSDSLDFQQLLDNTRTDISDYRATYMTFPFEPDLHITFYGEVPTGNPLTSEYASMITYHRESGENILNYDIRSANTINVIVDTFRKLHFGYFAGLPSKVIWCILGLSPFWLSLTGLYFYWFRNRRKTSLRERVITPA